MLFLCALAAVLATPKQFDLAGRDAFSALRDYERLERAHVKARDAWPTPAQHVDIVAKLAVAHDAVRDSFMLGADLVPGQGLSDQARSLLRAQQQAILALLALTSDGPPDVQKAARKVQSRFDRLFGLFPDQHGELGEHPPPLRPRKEAPVRPSTIVSQCTCPDPVPVRNTSRWPANICRDCGLVIRG